MTRSREVLATANDQVLGGLQILKCLQQLSTRGFFATRLEGSIGPGEFLKLQTLGDLNI